jgi:hypothetical protein
LEFRDSLRPEKKITSRDGVFLPTSHAQMEAKAAFTLLSRQSCFGFKAAQ